MQLGMIGLGRMGANMVRRLIEGGHQCVVFDMSPKAVEELAKEKAVGAVLARRLRRRSSPSRARVWLMVPAAVVDKTIADLAAASRSGRHPHRRRQLVLHRRHPPREGARGEGHPLRRRGHERRRLGPRARLLHDDRRRGRGRAAPRPDLRDARARASATSRARPAARRSAAPPSRATCTAGRTAPATSSRWCTTASSTGSWPPTPRAWASCAPPTSASSTHAIDAETTPLRDPEHYQYDLNLPRHRRGVAARQRDRLVAARPDGGALRQGPRARRSSRARVRLRRRALDDQGAIDEAVPAPVLTTALYERFSSRGEADFQNKLLSAMRFEFGGHVEKPAK